MAEQVVLTNAHFQPALTKSAAVPHTPVLRLLVAKVYGRAGRKLMPEADRQAMVATTIADAKAAPVFGEPEVSGNHVGLDRDRVSAEASSSVAKKFADRFGLDARAVLHWEQGRRVPDRAARVLLTVIDRDPEAVVRALKQ